MLLLLLPGVHLFLELLVEGLELRSLGQLEVDLGGLGVTALKSLSLHASLLHIPILGQDFSDSHCGVDASLSCSMKLHEVEVVIVEELLGKEDVEPEGSISSEEDHVGRLSWLLDSLLSSDFWFLLWS